MNYSIEGEPLPVVICNLEPNETMITEKGAMSWMTPNMKMETTSNGGIGKMFGRAFSGESMFQNRYTAIGAPGMIAFASSFPGCISRIYCRCNPFHLLPEAVRRRTLRWRRLHHAAAFRKRHCIPGI